MKLQIHFLGKLLPINELKVRYDIGIPPQHRSYCMKKAKDKDIESFASDLIEVIQNSKIFSEIDRAACESLLPHLERIILKQGDVLFEQGDPADCLYILVDGQLLASMLTAEGKHQIVGTIEKGEIVGELGALSTQPRSLTIRAAIDSRLLKFPRTQFEAFSKEQPKFIAQIIDLIISRSQNTLKVISRKKIYKHIAIIQANQNAPLKQFITKLKENFKEESNFIFLDNIEKSVILSHIIEQAEQDNKTVIFSLDEHLFPGLQTKLNHIGGIYIITDGDTPTELSEFALKMLSRQQTPFTTQYELILVHGDHVNHPTETATWLRQANFTLHHHIRINNNEDYQRLTRFMKGKSIGIVLGGGGQKGWASLGALKALLEAKVPIDAIGGTSVGAAVGACYAVFRNYEDTYSVFNTLSNSVSHPFSFGNLTWPLISLISARSPTEALLKVFNGIKIEDLWLPFFSIACNLSTGKEAVHNEGILWEKLRASAAIPGVAPPMIIDGELYFDGGLLNNLPVDHMQALLGRECITIAVSLTGRIHKEIKHYHFPPILPFSVTLLKKIHLGYKEYMFPPFFNTFLEALLVGSSAREKSNQLIADILISPDLSRFPTLKLQAKAIETLIQIGYSETQEQLQASKLFS